MIHKKCKQSLSNKTYTFAINVSKIISFMSKNSQPFPLAPVEREERAAQPSPSYGQDVRRNLYPSL